MSAFPIVGYLSDENSRIIQQHDSEENSAHQSSVDDRKKKSWAAKELKCFSKKFSSKRNFIPFPFSLNSKEAFWLSIFVY